MPEKKERKPLPKGFLDPLNTSKQWKPQGVKEIFGTGADVFGLRKKKSEEVEPENKEEGEEEDKEDEED
jgi:hypothetical protein